ncbi:MAG: Unknown protein [uncultured Sulfurovum sp.]|uniref:Uncharacterized protein n=1 Tax=uncultured Sulfurovum sp. TaxID=269237 RepID=A0A6S6SPC0_9BACT|nr:MAG: Unknown protein [uncultured Sulfurovum sp.]
MITIYLRNGTIINASKTQPPSFQNPITLVNIGKFIKARRTEQGLSTNDYAILDSFPLSKWECIRELNLKYMLQ